MEKKTVQINFRLGSDEFNTLQNYANDNELKQSDVIRRAIKEHVECDNKNTKKYDNSIAIINFLNSCIDYTGVCLSDSFFIEENHLIEMFDIYKSTGKNILHDYVLFYNIPEWIPSLIKDKKFTANDLKEYKTSYIIISTLKSIPTEWFSFRCNVLIDAENYIDEKDNGSRRCKAQRYISNKEVREEVFRLHGRRCLCCGTDKDISIDHVIPITRGGEDNIENLQPLCRSCNSKKSTQIIDYRK